MKKFLLVIGVAVAAAISGYLARDGLEMKGLYYDTAAPSTSAPIAPSTSAFPDFPTTTVRLAPNLAPATITPVIPIPASTPTEASDPYNDVPTRLIPTHPLQHDPLPRKDRIASPTILNGQSDAR
jgi:hypothetical protein